MLFVNAELKKVVSSDRNRSLARNLFIVRRGGGDRRAQSRRFFSRADAVLIMNPRENSQIADGAVAGQTIASVPRAPRGAGDSSWRPSASIRGS